MAIQKLAFSENSIKKSEFAFSLQRMSDQLRRVDQKLTMKVDNEITDTFSKQQQTIASVKLSLVQVKNRAIPSN